MSALGTTALETLVASIIYPNNLGAINPALLAALFDAFIESYPNLVDGGLVATQVVYNITTPTVVKAAPGSITKLSVIVGGTTDGTINDCTLVSNAGVANEVRPIPQIVDLYTIGWQCNTGITIIPGTGQTLAVSFN